MALAKSLLLGGRNQICRVGSIELPAAGLTLSPDVAQIQLMYGMQHCLRIDENGAIPMTGRTSI